MLSAIFYEGLSIIWATLAGGWASISFRSHTCRTGIANLCPWAWVSLYGFWGNQIQVLMIVWQALWQLSYSPRSNWFIFNVKQLVIWKILVDWLFRTADCWHNYSMKEWKLLISQFSSDKSWRTGKWLHSCNSSKFAGFGKSQLD